MVVFWIKWIDKEGAKINHLGAMGSAKSPQGLESRYYSHILGNRIK
jgi:hypothetical protein